MFEADAALVDLFAGDACCGTLPQPPISDRRPAAHGIPASYTQGLRKLGRDDYFRAVDAALHSSAVDVLVTHANAKLPGLHDDVLRDEDSPRLYDAFLRSSASLHVHGHMHTEPAVAVVAPGKVVVNADCRVVVFAAAADGDE